MKVKSITFDCPILYRGNISTIEEIRAPELNSYVDSVTYNKATAYFVVVNYGNSQYVIDILKHAFRDDNSYSKRLLQLSNWLQATVSIVKVTLNEDATYSFETVKSSIYKLTGLSIEDSILREFPKLSLITDCHTIKEYDENCSKIPFGI